MKRARVLLLSCVLATTVATAPAQTFTNLHSFAGSPDDGAGDGAGPNGTLLLVGSTLYGTTFDGGSDNNGVIFKLNTNSTGYSVTKHFPASSLNTIGVSTNDGGANPLGGLTLSGSTVYGIASQAGRFGSGTLFSFNTNGSGFSIFKDFPPLQSLDNTNDDGAKPNAGLLVVGDTCYGTTSFGGNFGNGTVFKIKTNGTGFTVLRHFAASSINPVTFVVTNTDGMNPQAALVLSGDSLYGTAITGGSANKGTVFKVSTNGTGFTVLKNFPPVSNTTNSDGAMPSPNLVLSGNTLYGTADLGGMSGNGTVFKVNTDGTGFTVLRSFSVRVSSSSTNVDGAFPSWGLVLSGDMLYGTTQNGGADGMGTLFGIKTNGTGFVAMHNFSPEEGNPGGNLILSGNTFYGTTENNSVNGFGIIFGFQLPSLGSPSTGALQVALSPPGAVIAGAQWQVDGGAFQNSGTTLTGIPYGNHLLSFKTVAGWIAPGDQVVVINAGATNVASRTYNPAPPSGALKVTINPAPAVSAGAQWQVDGGTFQNSGATVLNLPVGDYTLSFKTISGWVTPADQIVTITANTTNTASGNYSLVQFNGAVQVIINPPAAVTAGAHWKLDGASVPLYNSGDVVGGLTAGSHTVAFTAAPGWATPADTNVNVSAGTTNTVTGTYTFVPTGALLVTINPPAAVTAGAQWRVDGNSFQNSGAVVSGLLVTNHTLSFKSIAGWATPSNQTVAISADVTNNASGTYTIAELIKPTLKITAPTPNQRWSNLVFTITGTAVDNVAVASVLYQLNGAPWTNPATANGWSNWTDTVTLVPGTNNIRVYAVDLAGNRSVTNSVNFVYVLSDRLLVQTNGRGSVTPNLNGQMLQIGNRFTLTAKAATGFAFTNWTDGLGAFVTNKTALTFTMQSNLSFTANFIDITRPVLAVTNLAKGSRVSNDVFTVKGSAKDNVGVGNVLYSLNGDEWSNAVTANGWSNWTATVMLVAGSNNFRAFALDARGNASLTNSVNFTYIVSGTLVVHTNGRGTITPNLNGALLAIGVKYSMTAKAATGFAFTNWTDDIGTVLTNNAKLSFTMVSNLIFVANFRDAARPVNVITVPAVNQKWTNALFSATGKATDNIGVSNVWYKIGASDWNQATLAVNGTNWSTVNWRLPTGSNFIEAFATDGAGNNSLTNGVKFTYAVQPAITWAPDSLNGLIARVASSNSSNVSLAFDPGNFSQAGDSTNHEDFGFGHYDYNMTDTNMAQLTLSFFSSTPPAGAPETNNINLVFTNHYAGYFTNIDSGDSGGINLFIATNFVPGSLVGKTLTAIESDLSQTNAIKLVNGVGFTKTTTGGGSSSGTYTLARFSPVCALLTLTFTNTADVGRIAYVQAVFTNSAAGIYSDSSYNFGVLQDTGNGRFTVR